MTSPIHGASSSQRTLPPDLQDNEPGPRNVPTTRQSLQRQTPQRPSIFTGLGTAPADSNNASIRTGRSTLPGRAGEPVQGRSPVSPGGEIIGNAQTLLKSAAAPGSIAATVGSALKSERDAAARAHVTMKVDLGAFRENFRAIKDIVKPGTELSAVVKADAYGAGAVKVAQALEKEGCDKFFVAALDEALEMRKGVKPETTVFVLGGPLPGTARQFAENNITPVLNSLTQIEEWNKLGAELGKKLPAILQFDTGMSRQGVAPEERDKVKHGSDALANIDVKYVMSHLATASEATLDEATGERHASESMEMQRGEFDKIRAEYPGVRASLAASSALHVKDFQYDMVRVGGAIHGQHLFDDGKGRYPQPVTVTGRLAETRELNEGAGVGYGLAYHAATQGELGGTVQAGYADGVPRGLGSRKDADGNEVHGHIIIDGHAAPVTGNVSMDTTTVRLNEVLAAKKQALQDEMTAHRPPGVDIDSGLADRLAELETPAGIRDTFTKAKVVFSDDKHPFDAVAAEAQDGGDSRRNVSQTAIGFGNSSRVRKTYVDRSGENQPRTSASTVNPLPQPPELTQAERDRLQRGRIPSPEDGA